MITRDEAFALLKKYNNPHIKNTIMKQKTKVGIFGIILTTGLSLLCGLAYALNQKINGIDFDNYKEEDKF